MKSRYQPQLASIAASAFAIFSVTACVEGNANFRVSEIPPLTSFNLLLTPIAQVPLDIVVLLDNSASMEDELTDIGGRFQGISHPLRQIDWRMAFLSTRASERDGRFLRISEDTEDNSEDTEDTEDNPEDTEDTEDNPEDRYITKNTPNVDTVFRDVLEDSVNDQPAASHPILNFGAALRNTSNRSFFRNDSIFAALVITDTEAAGVAADPDFTAEEVKGGLDDIFQDIFGRGLAAKKFKVHGIVPQLPGCRGSLRSSITELVLQRLIELTGGSSHSICSSNHSAAIAAISSNIQRVVNHHTILLDRIPLENTLKVVPQSAFHSLEGRSLTLIRPAKQNLNVRISYDYESHYDLTDDTTVKAEKTWTWTCPESETPGQVCKTRHAVNKSESHEFANTDAWGSDFTATQAAAAGDTAEGGVKYYLHVQHAYFASEAALTPISQSESEVFSVYALLKRGSP